MMDEEADDYSITVGRKRSGNNGHNAEKTLLGEFTKESPSKRVCLRGLENSLKPDTPCIPSVKSRLQSLTALYHDEGDSKIVSAEDTVCKVPDSVAVQQQTTMDGSLDINFGADPPIKSSSRMGRLSALAQNINNWEDDLRHAVIKKEEPKAPTAAPRLKTLNTSDLSTKSSSAVTLNNLATSNAASTILSLKVSPIRDESRNSELIREIDTNNELSAVSTEKMPASDENRQVSCELNASTEVHIEATNSVHIASSKITKEIIVHEGRDTQMAKVNIGPAGSGENGVKVSVTQSRRLEGNLPSVSERGNLPSVSERGNLPSVSERLAGWQKKIETGPEVVTPRRSLAKDEGSCGAGSAVRSRVSMWQQKVTEEQTATMTGITAGIVVEVGKKMADGIESKPDAKSTEKVETAENASENKTALVIDHTKVENASDISGIKNNMPKQESRAFSFAETTTVNAVKVTKEPPHTSILSLIRNQTKTSPVPSISSQASVVVSESSTHSVSSCTPTDLQSGGLPGVKESDKALTSEMCAELKDSRPVHSVDISCTSVASASTSVTSDPGSVTSSMIDSEIRCLSSSGDKDKTNEEDDEDEDGVFEMLDDAIGDLSSECNSPTSDKSSEETNGTAMLRSVTPPSDGTSIASSQLSDTISTGHHDGLGVTAKASAEASTGKSATILRRHNSGSNANDFSALKKQNGRAVSHGGYLLDDHALSIETLADKRVTYIAEMRSGSTSSGSDIETTKSLDNYCDRSLRSKLDVRTTSTLRRRAIQKAACDTHDISNKSPAEQTKILQELISQEQSVIVQTSNAMNQCCHIKSAFASSPELVECHRVLLMAYKKKETYMNEISRLNESSSPTTPISPGSFSSARGQLTITDLQVPLKADFLTKLSSGDVNYFVFMIRCGGTAYFSPMLSAHDALGRGSIDVIGVFQFIDLHPGFEIEVELFRMETAKEPQTPKKKKGLTPMKLLRTKSPGRTLDSSGSTAVRTSNFVPTALLKIRMDMISRTQFNMQKIEHGSPLQGTLATKVECTMESDVEERGFLTLFEDINGFGAWHRRWCLLKNDVLYIWKYPDDEGTKDAIGVVDLKLCMTREVDQVPRDDCARPNTFELVTVRRQHRGESDTLVSTCSNNITTTKYWLSADTKDDRASWCRHLNQTLRNLRIWHTDSMPTGRVNPTN